LSQFLQLVYVQLEALKSFLIKLEMQSSLIIKIEPIEGQLIPNWIIASTRLTLLKPIKPQFTGILSIIANHPTLQMLEAPKVQLLEAVIPHITARLLLGTVPAVRVKAATTLIVNAIVADPPVQSEIKEDISKNQGTITTTLIAPTIRSHQYLQINLNIIILDPRVTDLAVETETIMIVHMANHIPTMTTTASMWQSQV